MKRLIISLIVAGLLVPLAQANPIFHRVKSGETFWSIAKLHYKNGSLGLKLHDRFIKSGAGWVYENGEHRHEEWDDTIRPIKPEELQIRTLLFIPKLKAVTK